MREMAMKKTLTALLALALTASLVGAAAAQEKTPNDPRLFTPGKLTVSTSDPAYPPWVLDNNPAGGEGFEAAFVYALAAELGFKKEDVVWTDVTFDGASAPGPKQYDFSIQQISVTPDRGLEPIVLANIPSVTCVLKKAASLACARSETNATLRKICSRSRKRGACPTGWW